MDKIKLTEEQYIAKVCHGDEEMCNAFRLLQERGVGLQGYMEMMDKTNLIDIVAKH